MASVTAITPQAPIMAGIPFPAATQKYSLAIPVEPLKDALNDLSEQSGIRILFPYDDIAGLHSRAVRGRLTVSQALDLLIAGVPLKTTMMRDGTIALSSTNPRTMALRRAPVIRIAQISSPGSDAALLAMAQTPAAIAPADDAPPSEIIVTGTRQVTRTVAESLAPIDVLSGKDLQTSGKQSVRDLLGTLVPSISVSSSGAGASFAVKTLSLRGLGGDQLLVLVNGKRRHNTATLFINGTTQNGQSPPDLDLIPASAIERVEVLRDGASAQYGSDAIAGVINLILKDKPGGTFSILAGQTWDGDGTTGQIQGDFGFRLGQDGNIHFGIDSRLQERTDRGQPNLQPQIYSFAGFPADPRDTTKSRSGLNHPGQPQVANINGSYDLSLPLSDAATFYSFGTISRRNSDAWLTYRNPNATNNIIEVYPDGYVPRLHVYDKDYQATAGLKGDDFFSIGWDISTSYARNAVKYHETTALNASLGPSSPTAFYIGEVIGTEWTSDIDLHREVPVGLAKPLFVAVGAEYRRNTYQIGAGEPASYIDGGYRTPLGQPLGGIVRVSGSQGVTGFAPSAAGTFSRHDKAAYINLEQAVIPGWDVALAGRYEDYSDAGTTRTGKASTRIEPIHGIAVRGTVSTGFRAPTLQQQHYASSSTIGVNGVLLPVQALPVNSPAAIALGATPLKPEKSTSISAGLVLTPTNRVNITVDAYQIKIRDRILLSGTLIGPAVNAALLAAGITSATSGFYFSNAASTRTRGLDIVGTWRAGLGDFGSALFSLSGNFNKTKFTHVDLPPTALANAGLVLIDRVRQGDLSDGTPKDKFIASVNWTKSDFGINARATRYGKVVQTAAAASATPAALAAAALNDDPIKSKVIIDLDISYTYQEKIKFTLGANNLLNAYPSVLKPINQGTSGFAYYNSYSPYGISGGFWYARMSFTF
jgi:iron complex outermembrane receptor protein